MKESLNTFFIGFILAFILSAYTVRWENKNALVILKETWVHYGLFTTNGVFYGLAAMFGKDFGRYLLIPFIKKIIKKLLMIIKKLRK